MASLLLASWPLTAAAAPMRVELSLEAPMGCIHTPELAKNIDGILGRSAIEASPDDPMPKVSVVLSHDAEAGSFRSVLTLETAEGKVIGTRELVREGRSCHVLDGPLALVAALLVDAAEGSVHLTVPPPSSAEIAAGSSVLGEPWSTRTEVAATLLLGLLPPAAGARLETRITPPRFIPLLLRFDAFPHTTTVSASGMGGEFLAMTGTVGVCPEHAGEWLSAGACLGVMSGFVRAAGEYLAVPGESSSLLLMGLAEGSVSIRLVGPVAIGATAGLAWGQWPANWHVTAQDGSGTTEIWKPWPVALLGSIGISIDSSSEKPPASGH
jgi:hypothetical protein